MMSAGEYLSELEEMRANIEYKRESREEYLAKASSLSRPLKNIKVQTSFDDGSKLEENVIEAETIDVEIEQAELAYYEHVQDIEKQIMKLHNVKYIRLLFKLYLQNEPLKQAAEEMDISYNYAASLHGKALNSFEKANADAIADWERKRHNG